MTPIIRGPRSPARFFQSETIGAMDSFIRSISALLGVCKVDLNLVTNSSASCLSSASAFAHVSKPASLKVFLTIARKS